MPGAEAPVTGRFSALLEELVRDSGTEPQLGWEPFLHPGLVVGRFELLREIARGGMGVVYEARDRELGRTVAFKALRGSLRPKALEERLLFEAEAAARCSHPNIVTLFDFGRTEQGPYLVLELLHGETLADRLRRNAIAREEALRIAIDITKGLAHAHSQGVIHRDLTPGNVFLCSDGQVKVLDLGMAHAFGRPVLEGGTPGYMAPEQCTGAAQDARTDVYALGAVFLRMFGTAGGRGLGDGAATASASAIPDRSLQALVARMLHPEPAARPQDAGAVLAALTEIDRAETTSRSRSSAPPRRGRAIAILFAVTLTLGAGWLLRSRVRSEDNPLSRARFAQLTDFEGVEQAAAISRDGTWVAFQSARDKQMDVWVTEVGTGRFSNLTRGSFSGIVNPSLRVLGFTPDGSAVTFWARTGTGNGPEISVWAAPLSGERVRPYLEGAAEYDWTGDGARLVYHTPGPGDPMYVRDAADTSSGRQIFSAPEGLHGHFLLWSPDRAFIYFVQGSPPDHLDIWRLPSNGGTAERLTFHDSAVTYPVFIDSRTLLYLAQDEDGAGPWIYALDTEKRSSRRLSAGIETYTSLAATGDGRRLVATKAGPKGTLWRVPFDGSKIDMSSAERIPLTTGDGSLPRLGPGYLLYVSSRGTGDTLWKLSGGVATELWSAPGERIVGAPASRRDGKRIAFTTRQRGETKLYVVNGDGTDARVLPSRGLAPRGAPAWTPDGKALTVASVVDGTPRLFTVPADGGAATPFVAEQSVDPVWSPRADVVAFSGADVGTMFPVKAVRADGRRHGIASLRLTRGARHFSFMPDGRSLLLMRGEIGHNNLWVVDLETGTERKVSDFDPNFTVKDFDLSPDGREIVLHQVQQQSDIVLLELPGS